MYIICTYDVDEHRCTKVMKILRKYLFHIQRSVFYGTLTPKQFCNLKKDIDDVILENDSVIFFYSYNDKQIYNERLGKKISSSNILIE